ncbi:hypothetical protein PGT21_017361 [Puccinia graminis f. sp. tritici]|uniref:Uncharacterized protein n=1 Tax=Puccinia graminis f. sp. tritici TaxID=56615 RepID=A0A5B0P9J2_PUCGR|nr:hypothetical protein PGT21_017361 [Puccinia graminis f. sp. tritici]KAA1126083.1 hypothetical protein PGTUg99_021578 [Puccinia graminis f. sp. tritici]
MSVDWRYHILGLLAFCFLYGIQCQGEFKQIDCLTAPLLETKPSETPKSSQAFKSAKNRQVFPFAMAIPVSKVRKGSQDPTCNPKDLADNITYEEIVKHFETIPQFYKQVNLFGNLEIFIQA